MAFKECKINEYQVIAKLSFRKKDVVQNYHITTEGALDPLSS